MNKKIITTLLLIVFVLGTMACPTFAETTQRTVLYEEDFENFSIKSFNSGFTASAISYDIADASDSARLNVGKFFATDIVEMTGYDGQPTEAVKITGDSKASGWTTTAGAARITLSGLSSKLSEITSGTLVYELKMYVPADINSAGEVISQSFSTMYMSPIVKSGDKYGVGTSYDSSSRTLVSTIAKGQWHKFTYVLLLDESKVLIYHNDVLTSYKVRNVTSKGYRFQVVYQPENEGSHIIFDDIKVWHTTGTLTNDGLTTASSSLDGAVDVSRLVKPQVTFDEMLLDKDTISVDNIEMAASDGTPVAIDSVSVSNDKKTITIDPASDLEWSTTYTVTVKNLLNMYQEKVADYSFDFTVMDEPPFASSQAVFTQIGDFETVNQETYEVSSLENGFINANYTITNNHDTESKNVIMFAVLRDGDALKAINFKQGTVAPRGSLTIDAGFEIDDYRNQSIEVYVWDDFVNRNALAPVYVISKNGIETTAQ